MSDATTDVKVTAASDIEVDRDALDRSIKDFAGPNGDYYVRAFHTIHDSTGIIPKTFNVGSSTSWPSLGLVAGNLGNVLGLPHPGNHRVGADRARALGQSWR